VGEDTVDVLTDLRGLTAEQIAALERDRIIATSSAREDKLAEEA
jgi:hypothetical protein